MDTTKQHTILVGVDIGSTTTKFVALDSNSGEILLSSYKRHGTRQVESLKNVVQILRQQFGNQPLRIALSGSGATSLARGMNIPFVQEVVANSIAVRKHFPETRCAIELGGQDAKMVFFAPDPETGVLGVADMRMNGSCASGTGAFIDEIAAVLKTPVEEFDTLAAEGKNLYTISGRCGVYAKTDIQPLLNQGIARSDLALSSMHAVVKQTIGGLAQGLTIEAPVIFEGGTLTFNPTLIRIFKEHLKLTDADVIVPEHPETMVALGTALSLQELFTAGEGQVDLAELAARLETYKPTQDLSIAAQPFFTGEAERAEFMERHAQPTMEKPLDNPGWRGRTLRAYLGIDSGSTTTKFVLINEDEQLVDEFYSPNEGTPLAVGVKALRELNQRYKNAGINLEILGVGTTGYGELLFERALHADYHVVETVAHATAAAKYEPEVSFILDIGGQDMKAIWLDDGIITDITVNEACSSGCGSFLENFASTLNVPSRGIAEAAFRSKTPATLGSRCTVFMNSSIISEQKNGKNPDDIMAGLCRSIIENVFTKVIRVSNMESLGEHIVVQGGTFNNNAVLAAMEQYLGKQVTRAPYPGLMGAIGVAILAKQHQTGESRFIGLDALENFHYTEETNHVCQFCANNCNRSIIHFEDGSAFVTGNRCMKGEVIGDPSDAQVKELIRSINEASAKVPNLFEVRTKLLFKDYPVPVANEKRGTVGFPRVLGFWDRMPFWKTLFRALGFKVKVSKKSSYAIFEDGLPAVPSDTVCFPAKLVHGHIRNLVGMKVDRIFFPAVTTVPSENTESTSESMCAVVKGYPLVISNSDNPEKYAGIPFDRPLFHWYSTADRNRQLKAYFKETFGIPAKEVAAALVHADAAMDEFHLRLQKKGQAVISQVERDGSYAVVLASRPYQNDRLVNHGLPEMFTDMGIPVLTADSVPGATDIDLSKSRLDIVNNFHARMLSTAIVAAEHPNLEYAQVVNFGCGHDAYLSDEIMRLMDERGSTTPLVVKVDESENQGPLKIRVRSFVETVNLARRHEREHVVRRLSDPYPVKYTEADRDERVVLVPNTSHAFGRMMSTVFEMQGARAISIPVGGERAIQLGKKYVHNDICFPAQITIGEILAELESGKYNLDKVAVATGKYIGDCRLTHYGALTRKALDEAGYAQVPIVTNDDVDYHDLHPGFKLSLTSAARIASMLPMIDILEELLRKIRPYELEEGSADAAFERALDVLLEGLRTRGTSGAQKAFARSIDIMEAVPFDRSTPKPRVLIVGEYLLNFHPGANHDIERYLEANGLEVIEARMTDVIRKSYFYKFAQIKEYRVNKKIAEKTMLTVTEALFERAHNIADRVAQRSKLYTPVVRMPELVKESDKVIHHTFDAGEGVLIPGEILHHAQHGCKGFVILQPFGCLPNHIVGRGIMKRLKELYPQANILALDYDPDVSFANIENRLQMLIMNLTTGTETAEEVGA